MSWSKPNLLAWLTTRFTLQAYLGATIVDHENRMLLLIQPVNDQV